MQQEPLPVPGTNAPVTRVEMLDQDLLPRPEVPWGAYLKLSPTEVQVILAEYEALRAEMVKQIELRQQPISITIVAFGGLIAASAQSRNPTFVLLYPTLALFLAAMWSYHNRVTHRIGRYYKRSRDS